MNTKNKEYKETEQYVAESNSNFNFIDTDGRVRDRWHHSCNPSRYSWIGEDGLSYWEGYYTKEGQWKEDQVFSCDVTDKKGITTLVFFARNHEYQDNIYLNEKRLLDFSYQNAVEAYEKTSNDNASHPMDRIIDLDQKSVHDMAFPDEETPCKKNELLLKWQTAVKETTTNHPEKLDLYHQRFVEGKKVEELVESRFQKTGTRVSNQAISDQLTNILKKAFKHLTGEEMPKRRKAGGERA